MGQILYRLDIKNSNIWKIGVYFVWRLFGEKKRTELLRVVFILTHCEIFA